MRTCPRSRDAIVIPGRSSGEKSLWCACPPPVFWYSSSPPVSAAVNPSPPPVSPVAPGEESQRIIYTHIYIYTCIYIYIYIYIYILFIHIYIDTILIPSANTAGGCGPRAWAREVLSPKRKQTSVSP